MGKRLAWTVAGPSVLHAVCRCVLPQRVGEGGNNPEPDPETEACARRRRPTPALHGTGEGLICPVVTRYCLWQHRHTNVKHFENLGQRCCNVNPCCCSTRERVC